MRYFRCPICNEASYGDGTCQVEHCRGNVARFELAKLRHGIRVRYEWAAMPVDRGFMWVNLMMELYRRFRQAGRPPRALIDSARIDASYCLDAPECMPAGACMYYPVDGADGVPAQIVLQREPA